MIVLQICLNWNSAFESSCCPSLMQFLWTWIYGVFSHSHMTSPSTLLVWRNSFDVFYQFCCPNVMTIALADLTVIIKNSQISPTWFLFYQSDVPNFVTMTLAEKGLCVLSKSHGLAIWHHQYLFLLDVWHHQHLFTCFNPHHLLHKCLQKLTVLICHIMQTVEVKNTNLRFWIPGKVVKKKNKLTETKTECRVPFYLDSVFQEI